MSNHPPAGPTAYWSAMQTLANRHSYDTLPDCIACGETPPGGTARIYPVFDHHGLIGWLCQDCAFGIVADEEGYREVI